jgi:hypothetical protein
MADDGFAQPVDNRRNYPISALAALRAPRNTVQNR